MKLRFKWLTQLSLFILLEVLASTGRGEVAATRDRPTELRCEYTENPIGIDELAPRFSWRGIMTKTGARQTAYRIVVASSQAGLDEERPDSWDSGRVESSLSVNIPYEGKPLGSRARYWWKVQYWDEENRRSDFSDLGTFEMGLLTADDWRAKWIGGPPAWPGRALYYRSSFRLGSPATLARLYVAGLGYYEASVNGVKQGDAVLEPAISDTSKRVFYRVFDVTAALRVGENVVGAIVGNGWENNHLLRAQLEVTCHDGSHVLVATGRYGELPNWQVTPGPILADSIYDGESYDARLEKLGWDRPGYSFSTVSQRTEMNVGPYLGRGPAGALRAEPLEPIKIVREFPPVKITEPKPGIWVADFGRNHAGWVRLRVKGHSGDRVTLRYGEILTKDGQVDQDNLKTVLATDHYVLSGEGAEVWSPRFTYHGYRYVQIEGWPGTPTLDAFTACMVRSAVSDRGSFECSDETLNKIHQLIRWTEEGNLHGVPTDCSDRNERMGWLNDLGAKSEELIYNFDLLRLFEKFVVDISDGQDGQTGAIADTAPFMGGNMPADPVSMSYLLIPTLLNEHYADTRVLVRHFDGMRRWVDYLSSRATNHIVSYSSWGDWAPPANEAVAGSVGVGALSAKTPGTLISTALYFYSIQLLVTAAETLGREKETLKYRSLAAEVGAAFNAKFWNDAISGYGTGNQACNVVALYCGLVPAGRHEQVVAALVREVERANFHLTTGNLCTKYLMEVLSAEGYGDIAVKIATQTTYPSWGFMLENGATALWERWELLTGNGMNSYNHPMLGSVGAWFYRWVAGVRFEKPREGAVHLIFQPPVLTQIDHARASVETAWGAAEISWRRTGQTLRASIAVPWNCTATVLLPNTPAREVTSGRYEYVAQIDTNK